MSTQFVEVQIDRFKCACNCEEWYVNWMPAHIPAVCPFCENQKPALLSCKNCGVCVCFDCVLAHPPPEGKADA